MWSLAVAWFSWATGAAGIPQEVSISEDAMSASCEGYEHRVVLSSVGFSRGVHYWELTIDRYHSDTDPAFGIARADVSRDQMLGKFATLFVLFFSSFFFVPEKENISSADEIFMRHPVHPGDPWFVQKFGSERHMCLSLFPSFSLIIFFPFLFSSFCVSYFERN